MNKDLFTLFLPIFWAIVSTMIGLVLYKSSSALFEQTQGNDTDKKRIRLAGSVTIAALAFYGMKTATPSSRLLIASPGMISVEGAFSFDKLQESSIALDRLALEVQGCVSTIDDQRCREKINEFKDRTRQLVNLSAHMNSGEQSSK